MLNTLIKFATQFISSMTTKKDKPTSMIRNILTNNTGMSVKSFFMFAVTIVALLLLLVVAFAIVWECVRTNRVTLDFNGFAAVITAIAALLVSAGIPKIIGDINEKHNRQADEKTATDASNKSENVE